MPFRKKPLTNLGKRSLTKDTTSTKAEAMRRLGTSLKTNITVDHKANTEEKTMADSPAEVIELIRLFEASSNHPNFGGIKGKALKALLRVNKKAQEELDAEAKKEAEEAAKYKPAESKDPEPPTNPPEPESGKKEDK